MYNMKYEEFRMQIERTFRYVFRFAIQILSAFEPKTFHRNGHKSYARIFSMALGIPTKE